MQQATSQKLGKRAEARAIAHLIKKGFTIQAQNYRSGRAEIDIIAQKENLLIFVEVKMRKSTGFGYPETFVTSHQQELYHTAASEYVTACNWQAPIRFDIIALHKVSNEWDLTHFEDAF